MSRIFEYIRGQREAEDWVVSLKGDRFEVMAKIRGRLAEIHKRLDECVREGRDDPYLEGWFDTLRHFHLNPSEIEELRCKKRLYR